MRGCFDHVPAGCAECGDPLNIGGVRRSVHESVVLDRDPLAGIREVEASEKPTMIVVDVLI